MPESHPIPISALQHFLFCPRQCALIHLEQAWAENRLTTEGRHLHDRAHDGPDECRAGVRITRGMAVFSERLGLTGQCDVVEFHPAGGDLRFEISDLREEDSGCAADPPEGDFKSQISNLKSTASAVLPVEYKRGKPKPHRADEVQLCAQALCLEDMFSTGIPVGYLYYGERRRRTEVKFDQPLRELTLETLEGCRAMFESRVSPPAVLAPHCASCSLVDICLPEATRGNRRSAAAWFKAALSGQ